MGAGKPRCEPQFLEFLMDEALAEARLAGAAGDVPVGAVVAVGAAIVGRGHNRIEARQDPTGHAELFAIRAAAAATGDWRLERAVLCVTIEPCPMCASAIKLARVPVVVFGAYDEQRGAFGSIFDLAPDLRIGPEPRVIAGIRAEECARLLKNFFAEKRR